ncbi:MAG TPA: hypothetical protein VD788_12220 [Candidatus Polarisedimenticolaceae bacterium]|nr:hypothetical protein [Candidatus Polarisedimenticolaceae bacterium]
MTRVGPSSFVLDCPGRPALRIEPYAGRWRAAAGGTASGWVLERTGDENGPFRLFDGDGGTELGCTSSLGGAAQRRELRYLLMGDGRLFRLSPRGPAEAGYDLSGWETPGAYLTARALEGGWQILPTPASGGIDDLLAVVVLLSAEILDAEERLVCTDGSETR